MTSEQLCARFSEVVGAAHILTDLADTTPHSTDWRKRWFGKALAVVKPATTEEVAAVVKICAETRTAIVPQGIMNPGKVL